MPIASWLLPPRVARCQHRHSPTKKRIRLDTDGIRNQVIGLTAAALEQQTFSEVTSGEAMKSLRYLLDTPISFRAAPELFCLDLYKDFDLDRLGFMARPTKITTTGYAVPPADARQTSESPLVRQN